MVVDHESVLRDLEGFVLAKNSHGQRDLLKKLAELRQEHAIQDESPVQRALRMAEVLDEPEPAENSHARAGAHGS